MQLQLTIPVPGIITGCNGTLCISGLNFGWPASGPFMSSKMLGNVVERASRQTATVIQAVGLLPLTPLVFPTKWISKTATSRSSVDRYGPRGSAVQGEENQTGPEAATSNKKLLVTSMFSYVFIFLSKLFSAKGHRPETLDQRSRALCRFLA